MFSGSMCEGLLRSILSMNPAAREYAFPTGRAPDHSGGARLLTSRLRVCTSASQARSRLMKQIHL